MGLQLGNETDATVVGLSGKLKLTGGSDKSGVPMRDDVHGSARKRVLLSKGVGLQDAEHGDRVRKLIRGNTISEEIYQIIVDLMVNYLLKHQLKHQLQKPKIRKNNLTYTDSIF